MTYTIIFRESAEKEFEALSQGRKKALFAKLKLLEDDPTPADSVELEGYAPLRRIKAGDARAIFDAPDAKNRIFVLRVGTNHGIYQELADLVDDDRDNS